MTLPEQGEASLDTASPPTPCTVRNQSLNNNITLSVPAGRRATAATCALRRRADAYSAQHGDESPSHEVCEPACPERLTARPPTTGHRRPMAGMAHGERQHARASLHSRRT